MKEFWKKLKSVRLAIGLIAFIAAGSILATLIPQGKESAYYLGAMPRIVAEIVTQTGLTRYFSSILFLLPMLAFFLNLGACTVDRLSRELRKKGGRRHGPDILHVGLLLLIVGSLVSFSGRQEGAVRLAPGDSVDLPAGESLTLKAFDYLTYDDGRPKDWVSTVDIAKEGKTVRAGVEIRVNRPLRLGALTIYQSSYSQEFLLAVKAPDGAETLVARGKSFQAPGIDIFYMTTEPSTEPSVVASGSGGMRIVARVKVGSGEAAAVRVPKEGVALGAYRAEMRAALTTGLEAVVDPGYGVVFAAFVMIGLGTALTFAQKLKDVNV